MYVCMHVYKYQGKYEYINDIGYYTNICIYTHMHTFRHIQNHTYDVWMLMFGALAPYRHIVLEAFGYGMARDPPGDSAESEERPSLSSLWKSLSGEQFGRCQQWGAPEPTTISMIFFL